MAEEGEMTKVRLLNAAGELVIERNFVAPGRTQFLDLSNMALGVYVLQISRMKVLM